jgi:hypothetical protein
LPCFINLLFPNNKRIRDFKPGGWIVTVVRPISMTKSPAWMTSTAWRSRAYTPAHHEEDQGAPYQEIAERLHDFAC